VVDFDRTAADADEATVVALVAGNFIFARGAPAAPATSPAGRSTTPTARVIVR
jgi:hypothetical protein